MTFRLGEKPQGGRSIRKQIEGIKRKKIASKKVVNLTDFRELAKSAESKTILVVDDDEIMRNAMKRILEGEGYKVILAEDGMELSKVLESVMLDLICLDVNLPWVDGYELCKLIKAHHALRHVPIILVSARKEKTDIEKGFEAGCDDYITKPFDVDFMTDTIGKYLLKTS